MALEPEPQATIEWLDILTTLFSGLAALGGVVALGIAIRALVVSRESVAVDQLFAAFSELIASLQEIARMGSKLSSQEGGESRSRATIDPAFQRFLASRARVDLATTALGLRGPYIDSVLDLANNFAAGVLQADEFGPMTRERLSRPDRELDTSWLDQLSWEPDDDQLRILINSVGFEDVWQSRELVDASVKPLGDLTDWWARRVTEPWSQDGRSVYSIKASYLVQTARLLDDFTREYVQPMCEAGVRRVASGLRRTSKPLT